ncbi:hypothetical protein FB45DRAFT_1029289 [Roridomyces roridus]|uniref:Uncharacterized protein n=1 Tax=Roridomyces roridus TaxID=1738132 RepID=A0AAD7BPB1_9AGAR|nr:hypothetical protein FB45DRAFT_1029289 [Roridomyces roridus]
MSTVPVLPPALQTAVVQIAETLTLTTLLDAALCGILSVQIYMYHLAFSQDRWMTKAFVYAIYVLDLVMTGTFVYDGFILYGSGFGDFTGATKIRVGWYMGLILGGFVALATQSFYAYRIFILSKSRLIPILIVIIAGVCTVLAVTNGILVTRFTEIASVHNLSNSITAGIWCAGSVLTDVLIAACMT